MSTVLGLDIGANSIGWALIDKETENIVDIGVRVFQEGVNNLNTGKEASRNATRSEKKQIRRQIRRRTLRKEFLIKTLIDKGFVTENELEEVYSLDPYILRKKAIYEKVELNELARIFLHLSKRRGYKSNRKEGLNEKDKGAIIDGTTDKPGISELRREVNDGGFKTVGEYFCSLNPHETRIRNRYTERKMYIEEFDLIWKKQSEYHSDILNEENLELIRDKIIYWQRPLKSQRHLIGKCPLETKKRRIPKSSPLFQEFRMLQQINSLSIKGTDRYLEETMQLSHDERNKIIEHLSKHKEVKFTTIKKSVLKLDPSKKYRFNLEHQEKIQGLDTIRQLRNVFGSRFVNLTEDDILKIWNILHFATDDEWLIKLANEKWGLDEDQAKAISKIKLEPNYGNLSAKAIKKLLPYMRDGMMYHEAAMEAGYDFSLVNENIEKMDYLPDPPRVANPIVNVAMTQLKILVNDIIDYYGQPSEVKIEMPRDLKLPRERRLAILSENKLREAYHNKIREKLIKEQLVATPTFTDITKFKLWEECHEVCPYTGKSIALHQLFNGEVEIEHIIPYSISLDNSFMNLSLCFKSENNKKSNKTPWQAYSGDKLKYEGIKERIKTFPFPKSQRFLMDDKKLEEKIGDFISRQLNDTRYISVIALKYMKHVSDDVSVATGQTTSTLRKLWGLNSLLNKQTGIVDEKDIVKSREDHRHHAVDALVTALTTRSILQRLSTRNRLFGQRDIDEKLVKKFPLPWENFRNETKEFLDRIVVSFRANKKVRGQLHDETLYGKVFDRYGDEVKNDKNNPLYVVRKPLSNDLTHKQIKGIVDDRIREIVFQRLEEHGVDINSKFKVPSAAFVEPLYLIGKKGTETPIKKVRIHIPANNMVNIRNYNIWTEPGSNHHMIIYVDEKGKQKGKIMTLYETIKRKNDGLPVIDKELEPNQEFLMYLMKNELVIQEDIPVEFDYADKSTYKHIFNKVFRVQKMTGNILVFRLHSSTKTDETKHFSRWQKSVSGVNCTKIYVSPAGFIEFTDD